MGICKGGALMNNKQIGNRFEQKFCEILFQEGFWTHNLAQNSAGQPADVIAVRHRAAYLIDCKVCSSKAGFALSRIEDNQELAMRLWEDRGNGTGWFAIQINGNIYMASLSSLLSARKHYAALSEPVLSDMSCTLEQWLSQCL